jgi:hypothetical protein
VSGASGCGFTASRFGKKAKTIPNWKKYIQAARVPVMARGNPIYSQSKYSDLIPRISGDEEAYRVIAPADPSITEVLGSHYFRWQSRGRINAQTYARA